MRGGQLIDVSYLFKNDMPSRCDVASLMEFASPHYEVPRGSGSDEIILDYKIDSDFIVAGFWEHYQIDLTSMEPTTDGICVLYLTKHRHKVLDQRGSIHI